LESTGLTYLWEYRWKHIIEILERGISIILSDVDVVWKKRPSFSSQFDIWGSQGTFPKNLYKKNGKFISILSLSFFSLTNSQGFAICNGLIYLSSNQRVIEFVDLLIFNMKLSSDDQVSPFLQIH